MRTRRIATVAAAVSVLAAVAAGPALARDRDLERVGSSLARDWAEENRGGAPVSPEFAAAALRQGLTAAEVQLIFASQALHGPQTTSSYTSSEVLDHFVQHPELIPDLLEAVRSVSQAPRSYAAFLAADGSSTASYRSYDQLLQEAVLAIEGARDAYLSGVTPPATPSIPPSTTSATGSFPPGTGPGANLGG